MKERIAPFYSSIAMIQVIDFDHSLLKAATSKDHLMEYKRQVIMFRVSEGLGKVMA